MTRTSDGSLRARRPVALVSLRGPDARRFANGMFTNNVRDLPVGAHQHSALTDDRGRIEGLMDLVCVADDHLVLALEGLDADAFEARYGPFIVFDDVELDRPSGGVWVVRGAPAPAGAWPSPRLDGGWEALFDALPAALAELPEVAAESLEPDRIARGWPRFPVDASDKQLPQELGLRDTHLHFEKGCYRGQETIHRLDVMGQVRKRLAGVRLGALAPIGASITAGGAVVGRLGSSAVHPTLGPIGLAVIRTTHTDEGTAVEVDGVPARVADLPFRERP